MLLVMETIIICIVFSARWMCSSLNTDYINIPYELMQHHGKLSDSHTVDAVSGNELHCMLNAAARLEGSTVWIDVHVTHGSLDPDAEVRRASGVCVQDIDKGGIVG